ncbi:MAG: ATP-binding cassette domain-containing protein [Rhodothermales bacterium]|nr:ATP-binding cassette domain-containing protein [Rhodothermales bacterium]
MIQFTNISHRYGRTTTLHEITHHFEEGTTTVLIGPSGCGKSTLLRCIVGLVIPDSGTIRIGDKEVNSDSIHHIRKSIGYVIQDGGLFPHLTARDNATLLARQEGWTEQEMKDRTNELVDVVQLSRDHLDKFPSQLSGGQQQRISIIRALMLDPEILLMDEPLGALDSIVRADLQRDLFDIFESLNKTVILITHDLAEAAYFSDNLLLMQEGAVVIKGSLRELHESSLPFVTDFVLAQQQAAVKFIEKLRP